MWNHIINNLQTPSLNSDMLALSFMCLLIFNLLKDFGTSLQVGEEVSETGQCVSVIRNVSDAWDLL